MVSERGAYVNLTRANARSEWLFWVQGELCIPVYCSTRLCFCGLRISTGPCGAGRLISDRNCL